MHYAQPNARNMLAFFDGSASQRLTRDANHGMQPNAPNGGPTVMSYSTVGPPATPWMPDPIAGPNGADMEDGYYRWTRSGLRGVDFGGTEVRGGGY
jgi:hypothetical protein